MATVRNLVAMECCEGFNTDNQYIEDTGLTLKAGATVVLAAGKVQETGADPAKILGIAVGDASGTVNTKMPVYLADDENEFIANVYVDGTGASTAANALLITDLGADYGIVKVGTNWHIDKGEVAAKCVRIIGIDPHHVIGDFYALAKFKFLLDVRQVYPGERTS